MNHILHIITGLHRGGAETVLLTLVTELARPPYAYRQTVIYFHDGALRAEFEKLGIALYQNSYGNFIYTLPFLIKELKPTLIHGSLFSTGIIARIVGRLFSIPVYCSLHALAEHSGIVRNSIDALVPSANRYIAVSDAVKKSYMPFLPASRITVIENGIPSRKLLRVTSVRNKHKQYTIGAVGRFVPVKNYALLLDAVAMLTQEFPHIRLLIVGHGPLEGALRKRVRELKLCHVVTFIINEPAHTWYLHYDCFVQPSQCEGFSLTIAEALQSQVPVIATGKNGQHPFIEHETHGIVIEPDSVKELHGALRRYILNPDEAAQYASVGRQYIQEKFSASRMATRYAELFSESHLHSWQ